MRRTCWVLRDTFLSFPYADYGMEFWDGGAGLRFFALAAKVGAVEAQVVGADGVYRLPSLVKWSVLGDVSTAAKHVIAGWPTITFSWSWS